MDSFTFFYDLGIKNVLLLSSGTINLVFAALIYFTDRRSLKNIYFSLIAVSVSVWAFTMAIFYYTSSLFIASLVTPFLYVSAGCLPLFFYFLVNSIQPETRGLIRNHKNYAVLLFSLTTIIVCIPDLVVIPPLEIEHKVLGFGSAYWVYAVYLLLYFFISFKILIDKYSHAISGIQRKQILFLSSGIAIAVFIGLIVNLILPFFGFWNLYWFGPAATIIMIVFVGYSTIRHHLFNTKSVAVESVTFVLWVAMLMRLFLSNNVSDLFINFILFVLIIGGGLIFIKTIYDEIDRVEEMKRITNALEVANEHLREIDKQKSEFVSIASHQLRTPLTAIIGYSSMILEGAYGAVSEKTSEVVDKIYQSSRRLSVIIDDFLTISHIENGKMNYVFEKMDLKKLVENLVDEAKQRASKKNLTLSFHSDGFDLYTVTADEGKIRQVLSNLIDNSIKYTEEGHVEVRLSRDFSMNKMRIMIRDTGIGLSQETIGNLFKKFSRASGVQKIYTDGSGIGLYIAQEIIKAHHGRLWVESEGEGKGSTFFVELLSEQ